MKNSNNYTKSTSTQISFNQKDIYTYLKDLRKINVLNPEREKELANIMNSDSVTEKQKLEVERELVEGNLRFVITIAKQYQNQGLELSDLIAEGNLGLIKAIKNFDWSKDIRFISYAVWWIKQSILQCLSEHSRIIRLPVNIVQEMQREKRKVDSGDSEESEKFAMLPTVTYLENTINEEGDSLIDLIVNDNATLPDNSFNSSEELHKKMLSILNVLDSRERIIIEDYFGLSGNTKTLEDIGEDLDLTKERVRQIKEKALRKLRNESEFLFDYI